MNFHNISDPEELFLSKIESDRKLEKQCLEENKPFIKPTITDFVNSLQLQNNIFVYQDKDDNVHPIPYSVIEDNCYWTKIDNEDINKAFKKFIGKKNLKFTEQSSLEILQKPLTDSYYVIRNNRIYIYE